MLTCPVADLSIETLPVGVKYMKGQQEIGHGTGYHHWQVVFHTKPLTLVAVKRIFPTAHLLPTDSVAAEKYVWKEDTRVADTQFELGTRSFKRNSSTDWAAVRTAAQSGALQDVPDDVFIRCYSNLRRIALDHQRPQARGPIKIRLFHGPSGTGKSHAAFSSFGPEEMFYSKIPTTKWWDGYQGEANVIIDEFRGQVSIGLLLRWLDPAGYPLTLEVKGGGCCAKFTNVILTSNLLPEEWYPELDAATKAALNRRIEIINFNTFFTL
jgi:hypothetical protein